MATTSVANIANLGFSASVVKFVAKYLARGDKRTAADVIQTSTMKQIDKLTRCQAPCRLPRDRLEKGKKFSVEEKLKNLKGLEILSPVHVLGKHGIYSDKVVKA